MQKFSFQVLDEDKGLRLDQYVIKKIDISISRSRIQSLIVSGNITVNQKSAKANYKVKVSDVLLLNIPPAAKPQTDPENIPLEIIYEDEDILIVNKPEGMVTHPAPGNYEHTLVNALLGYGCPLSSVNGPLRPGIVHRLDKATSGVMVIPKNDLTHHRLARQFQKHSIYRQYLAVVEGVISHDEGIIDLPIGRDTQNRQKMVVSFLKQSRHALTKYKVLKRYKQATLVELTPETGRTHQLRVHLKALEHPILGDKRYGKVAGFNRLALHALLLGFKHPRSKKFVQFRSEIPKSFQELLELIK